MAQEEKRKRGRPAGPPSVKKTNRYEEELWAEVEAAAADDECTVTEVLHDLIRVGLAM